MWLTGTRLCSTEHDPTLSFGKVLSTVIETNDWRNGLRYANKIFHIFADGYKTNEGVEAQFTATKPLPYLPSPELASRKKIYVSSQATIKALIS